jgi:flagellum-specific peptidoglycan hydrolase FlgJ
MVDAWMAYPCQQTTVSPATCFDHSKDPAKFVDTLAAAGYATDPNYATKIKNIIRRYRLTDYDQ